jgi:hypothetical protein
MNTNKLITKLENFFSLSEKKQKEKSEKLLKIISKLERKKARLEIETLIEKENNMTSERYHELDSELNVIDKLIEKARSQISQPQADDSLPNNPDSQV